MNLKQLVEEERSRRVEKAATAAAIGAGLTTASIAGPEFRRTRVVGKPGQRKIKRGVFPIRGGKPTEADKFAVKPGGEARAPKGEAQALFRSRAEARFRNRIKRSKKLVAQNKPHPGLNKGIKKGKANLMPTIDRGTSSTPKLTSAEKLRVDKAVARHGSTLSRFDHKRALRAIKKTGKPAAIAAGLSAAGSLFLNRRRATESIEVYVQEAKKRRTTRVTTNRFFGPEGKARVRIGKTTIGPEFSLGFRIRRSKIKHHE